MKKNVLKKWLAMTLALTLTFSSSGLAVLAAEEPADAAAVGEAAGPAEESGTDASEEEIAEEAVPEAGEEDTAADGTTGEAADRTDEEEEEPSGPAGKAEEAEEEAGEAIEADDRNDPVLVEAETVVIAASAIEIAGKAYAYADVSEVPEGSEATITVDGEEHKMAEFTAIGDTGIVYYSADPLSGSLYGTDPAQVTSYTDFYSSKGVNAESADYDVITSATAFSGFHAKDISPLIARSEDGITGIYDSVEVDAVTYAEASILKSA